jgi:hypothetical protein
MAMRDVFVAAAIVLAAAGCSGIEPGAVHDPDSLADAADVSGEPGTDPGGLDAFADEGPRLDAPPGDEAAGPDDTTIHDGVIEDEGLTPGDADVQGDADIPITTDDGVGPELADVPEDIETADNSDVEVGPGTILHFGWFGPGSVGAGGGLSAFGSACGPQQAWKVQ